LRIDRVLKYGGKIIEEKLKAEIAAEYLAKK
jgi:hypothetical protein